MGRLALYRLLPSDMIDEKAMNEERKDCWVAGGNLICGRASGSRSSCRRRSACS